MTFSYIRVFTPGYAKPAVINITTIDVSDGVSLPYLIDSGSVTINFNAGNLTASV